jgi:hypothetical protein
MKTSNEVQGGNASFPLAAGSDIDVTREALLRMSGEWAFSFSMDKS